MWPSVGEPPQGPPVELGVWFSGRALAYHLWGSVFSGQIKQRLQPQEYLVLSFRLSKS